MLSDLPAMAGYAMRMVISLCVKSSYLSDAEVGRILSLDVALQNYCGTYSSTVAKAPPQTRSSREITLFYYS